MMKYTPTKIVGFALVSATSLVGCLTVDRNIGPVDEACAIPPVTAQEACEREGLRRVLSCRDDGSTPNCTELDYQVGGDCGEATATILCAEPESVCVSIGVLNPCRAEGLEPINPGLCDAFERRTSPPPGALIGEPEQQDSHEEYDQDEQPEIAEPSCGEGDAFDSEMEPEVGCVESPQEPIEQVVCTQIRVEGGCGDALDFTCKLPTQLPVCPSIYAPVCGEDGLTYGNDCLAGSVRVVHQGECEAQISNRGSCIDEGLLADHSSIVLSAEWLPEQSGAWIDEEGNLHTVDDDPQTQFSVEYDVHVADLALPAWGEEPGFQSTVITREALEIIFQPLEQGEVESEMVASIDYFGIESEFSSAGRANLHANGHLEGDFIARLHLRVGEEACSIRAPMVVLPFDAFPPPPHSEPEPEGF